MAITIEKVEAIAAKLRAMPPVENKKREVSKQESIKLLTAEIAAMRERGYTLEQIAALLTEDDFRLAHPRSKATCNVPRPPARTAASSARRSARPHPLPPARAAHRQRKQQPAGIKVRRPR